MTVLAVLQRLFADLQSFTSMECLAAKSRGGAWVRHHGEGLPVVTTYSSSPRLLDTCLEVGRPVSSDLVGHMEPRALSHPRAFFPICSSLVASTPPLMALNFLARNC